MELRGCWEEGLRRAAEPAPDEPVRPWAPRPNGGPLDRPDPMRLRGFVPIEELVDGAASPTGRPDASVAPVPPLVTEPARAIDDWAGRTTLFGDVEA